MKHTRYFEEFLRDVVNLNQTRLDRLSSHVSSVKEFLEKSLGSSFIKIEPQGSYGLKTIIKPVADNDEYDADIQVYMTLDEDLEPKDYIKNLYKCFRDSDRYKDKVHRRTRCVSLDYAGDFHLDAVPCFTDSDGKTYICNYKTNESEETDGTGYREWFNKKTSITHGNLKRVTRLLKFLRDHKSNFTVKSILFTTLIGNTVGDESDASNFNSIPVALKTVSNRINEFLQNNPVMPEISNPVLQKEKFNRHWDQTKYSNFREKFRIYNEKINDAFDEKDHNESVKKWREIFGDDFGELKDDDNGSGKSGGPAAVIVRPQKPHAQ